MKGVRRDSIQMALWQVFDNLGALALPVNEACDVVRAKEQVRTLGEVLRDEVVLTSETDGSLMQGHIRQAMGSKSSNICSVLCPSSQFTRFDEHVNRGLLNSMMQQRGNGFGAHLVGSAS